MIVTSISIGKRIQFIQEDVTVLLKGATQSNPNFAVREIWLILRVIFVLEHFICISIVQPGEGVFYHKIQYLMKAHLKPVRRIIILILFLTFLLSCRNENNETSNIPSPPPKQENCACPIDKATTETGGEGENSSSNGFNIGVDVKADIPYLKKLIQAQLGIGVSGSYEQEGSSSETVYWKILEGNPEIAQHANLYRDITCALIQIACENPVLKGEALVPSALNHTRFKCFSFWALIKPLNFHLNGLMRQRL